MALLDLKQDTANPGTSRFCYIIYKSKCFLCCYFLKLLCDLNLDVHFVPDLTLIQQEVDALEELSRQLFLETVDLYATKVQSKETKLIFFTNVTEENFLVSYDQAMQKTPHSFFISHEHLGMRNYSWVCFYHWQNS